MGIDIHAFIEYVGPWGEYRSLAQGQLNLIDDERIFKAIAFGDSGQTDALPVPPRNLPTDCSDDVRDSFLVDAREYSGAFGLVCDGESGDGSDEDITGDLADWMRIEYRNNNRLPNPYYHTSSWLTLSEFELSLSKAGLTMEDLKPDMRAAVASMRALVRDLGDDQVRLVFWFDG